LKVKLLSVLATMRGFHRIGDNTQKHKDSQECGDWTLVEFVRNYKWKVCHAKLCASIVTCNVPTS